MMNEIQKASDKYHIYQYYKGFENMLESNLYHVQKLQDNLADAIQNRKFDLYIEINKEARIFKQSLDNSIMYSNYCTFMHTYFFNEKLRYPDKATYHSDDPSVVQHFREISEQIFDQMAEIKDSEISKLKEKYKKRIAKNQEKRQGIERQLEEVQAELNELKQTSNQNKSKLEEKINSLKSDYKLSLENNVKKIQSLIESIDIKDTDNRNLVQDIANEKLANFEVTNAFKAQVNDLEKSIKTLKKELKNKTKIFEKETQDNLNKIDSLEAKITRKGNKFGLDSLYN